MSKSNLKDKKLQILGGVVLTKEIMRYTHKLGMMVYVTDYLKYSPKKELADRSFMVSITEPNIVAELVKTENIDGILTGFVNMLLPYYQQI